MLYAANLVEREEGLPVAGPSSRPYVPTKGTEGRRPSRRVDGPQNNQSTRFSSRAAACELGDACPLLQPGPGGATLTRVKRQNGGPTTSASSSSTVAPSFSSSSNGLFVGPSTSSTSASQSLAVSSQSSASSSSSLPSSATAAPVSTMATTTRHTSLYSVTRTSAAPSSSVSQYVPGVLLNLTLTGDSDTQAVYGVPMSFGHGGYASTRRSLGEIASIDYKGKRRATGQWDGTSLQTMTMQVDLGSSDLWVATTQCTTSDCSSAPQLFNSSGSIDSGVSADLSYQRGSASGDIMWEEVQLGTFGIGYQAFVAATSVNNEGLGSGQFSGLLGLALPANSIILGLIPGTTSNNPDGATFLDNLFGSGSFAPSQRLFSLALARREDVRTRSVLGIGATANDLCASPCNLTGLPIVAQPSLGITGFLHWRVAVNAVSALKFDNAQAGTGMSSSPITLGASQAVAGKAQPIAVLDSGGVEILMGYKPYVDGIYAAFGVSASPDGLYRMPCTQPISLSFRFDGREYPVHPLDMSWPDPDDPAQKTCIGAIQYTSSLGETGDFILGSAFLKNVYSVFNYPDYNRSSWQPTVGLASLTNASVASQDFYAVRTLRQSLSSVSANGGSLVPGGSGANSPPASSTGGTSSKAVVSTGIIIGASIGGVLLVAVVAFCAWWFWARRKFGAGGAVQYRDPPVRPKSGSHKSDMSTSSLHSRSRKHDMAQRQKSMVEGYSDYEGDSWLSGTEGADSIRLGYLPEVAEDTEDRARPRHSDDRESLASSRRAASVARTLSRPFTQVSATETPGGAGATGDLIALDDLSLSPRDASHSRGRNLSVSPTRRSRLINTNTTLHDDDDVPAPAPYAYPSYAPFPASAFPPAAGSTGSAGRTKRNVSMSMSGPFPSPMRASVASGDLVSSPLHDIRNSDYFGVVPGPAMPTSPPPGGGGGGGGGSMGRAAKEQ